MAFSGLSSFRSVGVLLAAFLQPAAALVCYWGLRDGLTTTPVAAVPSAAPGARTVDAIVMPHDEPDVPPGPHREAFQTSCTVCHSTRLVLTQPPFSEKTWTAWIPIVYSGAMVVVCLVCLLLWNRRGRQAHFYAFAFSVVVGLLRFWLHNQGRLFRDLATVLDTWTRFEHHADTPPTLAPLSFCGLGGLGMLECAAQFQPVPLGQNAVRSEVLTHQKGEFKC
jgi:hypothetical protein